MSRESELAQFPPALRALIDAELAAGNEITEIAGGFPAPPVGTNLKFARRVSTPLPEGVTYRDRPQHSLYSGEFTDATRHFFILNPPDPPPGYPDMDEIRARLAPPTSFTEYKSRVDEPPQPKPDGPVEKFRASMNLSYDNWREGDSYALDILAQASGPDRSDIEAILLAREPSDWRDVEALAAVNSIRTRAVLQRALSSGPIEIRLAVLRHAPELVTPATRSRVLVDAIQVVAPYHGLTLTIDLITERYTPSVHSALLRAALHRPGEAAVHFAALLYFLHGKADSIFDWNHRPFFLRFNATDPAERAETFRELCATIGVDPAPYLESRDTLK